MRLIFLILISLPLAAAEPFWQQVVSIEEKFYTPHVDTNASEDAKIDAKIDAFKQLIHSLKADPYSVENRSNPFFRPAEGDEQLYRLSAKLRANREQGYTLAMNRNRVALDSLKLRQHIFLFFSSLAKEWTTLDTKTLEKQYTDELTALKGIDNRAYEKKFTAAGSDVDETMKADITALHMHADFFRDVLNYLQYHTHSLHYRSLVQRLQLGSLIAAVNDNAFASKVNVVLRYLKLNAGQLTLFTAVLLAWGIASLFFFWLYRRFIALISSRKSAIDEMLLNSIESSRRPVFILIIVFGIDLGFEILRYPHPPEATGLDVFYFIYLVLFSYILMVLVDNFFYHYLLKETGLKNLNMRGELVNLIVSIIKVVIVIITALFFLVHLGVNITGLVASLGIGGLALALAAKDTLSNFFGLLKILSDNSLSQGDLIEAGKVYGTVVEIGFISTNIRTADNGLIIVPNDQLVNNPLKNWSRRQMGRLIKMQIRVSYGSDREQLAKAVDAIHDMLYNHPDTVDPDQTDDDLHAQLSKQEKRMISVEDKFGVKNLLAVYLDELSESSMDILVFTYSKSVAWLDWLAVKQDVIYKIWEILDAHGLAFAFPSQSLYFDRANVEETIAPLKTGAASGGSGAD
jgi:MscS family membrane protein